ncbi:MAG: OmpH family outer membrane protein [candidate division WOR-3 bacterium]|nr:OmpH family outer membrane protein [candidate division WOR-3 bacterium]
MINIRHSFLLMVIPLLIVAKEQKVGFVESSKILAQYQATARANEQFNEFVNICRDSAAKLQLGIQNLKNEFEAQKLMLSEEARLKKLDEIERFTQAYNQYLQDVFGPGGKIEQKNDELMAPLLKKINDAIAKIAQQEGFSMVLDLSEDIFYASPELNITDLVINELNREYGVTTTLPGAAKKYIGILPLKEENNEAMAENLGMKCQNELYNALKNYEQSYNIVSKAALLTEMTRRKLDYKLIDENQAFQVASYAMCNYIIMGKVSKTGTRIDYTISLRDVSSRVEIASRSSSVTDDIKFSESLRNDLMALIEALRKSK